ncbi:MAG: hypothetical protein KDB18_13595, partial [Salinibacterium sp.]|nr:hypothetical protein [Salinibacterium sp.]
VQDKLGYHVFLVAGKRPAPPLSPEITQDIRLRRARDAFMSAWRDAKRGYDLRPIVNESR